MRRLLPPILIGAIVISGFTMVCLDNEVQTIFENNGTTSIIVSIMSWIGIGSAIVYLITVSYTLDITYRGAKIATDTLIALRIIIVILSILIANVIAIIYMVIALVVIMWFQMVMIYITSKKSSPKHQKRTSIDMKLYNKWK